jgi:hypothetical protein
MAPGQRQDLTRVALQQAQKSAEALFETKSIADIKKVRKSASDRSLKHGLRLQSPWLKHAHYSGCSGRQYGFEPGGNNGNIQKYKSKFA